MKEEARFRFLDGLRGLALVLMVLNHTARWWLDASMGWGRYYLIYATVTLAAPLFLFLVGFSLAIAAARATEHDLDWRGAARRSTGRGLRIVAAGLLLNAIVFPEHPIWTGGVLQTIGLSIVVAGLVAPIARHPAARVALVAVAAVSYATFAQSFTALGAWSAQHPRLARIVFADFPPWPWIGLPLLGLVMGAWWMEARRRDTHAAFTGLAVAGVAAAAVFVLLRWGAPAPRLGFMHDYILNRHWTPGGVTILWILAMLAVLVAAAHHLMEVRKIALDGLVVLGRTAMSMYFVHHLIVLTLVNQWLGVRFDHWVLYGAANIALLVLLVWLGRGWLAAKAAARHPGFSARWA